MLTEESRCLLYLETHRHTHKSPPCVVLQVDDHDEVDDESENPSRHTRNKESSVVLLCDLQNGVHDDAKPPPFTKNKVPILEHKSEKASRRTDPDVKLILMNVKLLYFCKVGALMMQIQEEGTFPSLWETKGKLC